MPKLRVRYKGLFDFDGLYNLIAHWFKSRGYWFHETTYKHKVPSPLGAEDELKWEGTKKVNDYVQYEIEIEMHLWDMTEVEVEKDGVKKTLTNARFELIIDGDLEIDYQGRWQRSAFWAAVGDFYHKYIIKKEWETVYGDELWYRMQKLQNTIKEFMDMQAKGYEYKGYLGEG